MGSVLHYAVLSPGPCVSHLQAQFLVSTLWWDSGPVDPPPGWPGCEHYTLRSEREWWGGVWEFPAVPSPARLSATATAMSLLVAHLSLCCSPLLLLSLQLDRAALLQLPPGPRGKDRRELSD